MRVPSSGRRDAEGRGRTSACGAGCACALRLTEERRSRIDGQVCPSILLFMVLRPAGSPYKTYTNRWGLQVEAAPHLQWPHGLHPPPTCGDWCRFRAAGRGSDVLSTCGRSTAARTRRGPLTAGASRRLWSKIPFCEGWRTRRSPWLVKKAVLRRQENECRRFSRHHSGQNPSSRLPPPRAERPISVFHPPQNGISDHGRGLLRFPPSAKRNF